MSRKLWQEPRLIILVRAKPEEAVLQNCKTGTAVGGLTTVDPTTPSAINSGCYQAPRGPAPAFAICSNCSDLTKS